jgi:DNA segregation ATPase FtsK/SpoIIIE-like protein
MLIGGYTGSGKTNLMRSIVVQLGAKHPPDEVQVAIVDTKEVDFAGPFDHMPQLFQPIARDQDEAEALIEQVEAERIRRQAAMARGRVSDWRKLPEPPPLLLLMIDEAADFTATPAMDTLVQIARKGRAFGVSLVVSTQYPTKRVIDAQVRANLTTAIAFPTTTATESRVIINRTGAEHLRQKGRCLTFLDGRWREVQTFFVEEETVEALLGLTEKDAGTVLPPLHIELVRYAQAELDGAFIINRLYGAFQGKISKRKLTELAQHWEMRGWLTEPTRDESGHKQGRCVTEDLLSLCTTPSPDGRTRWRGDMDDIG